MIVIGEWVGKIFGWNGMHECELELIIMIMMINWGFGVYLRLINRFLQVHLWVNENN